jgi:hypothetical protein
MSRGPHAELSQAVAVPDDAGSLPKRRQSAKGSPLLSALNPQAGGELKSYLLGSIAASGKARGYAEGQWAQAAPAEAPIELQQVMSAQVRCGDSSVRVGDLISLLLNAGSPPEAAAAAVGPFVVQLPLPGSPQRESHMATAQAPEWCSAEALRQAVLLAAAQRAAQSRHQQHQDVYVDARGAGRLAAMASQGSFPAHVSASHNSSPGSAGLLRRSVDPCNSLLASSASI